MAAQMSKNFVRLLVALVVVAALVFGIWWLRRRAASAETPSATTSDAKKSDATPEIWLSVNGSGDTEVAPAGWPLIVQVLVQHPRAMQTNEKVAPIMIAPREGSWANAVRFTVRSEKGGSQSWPLNPVAVAEPTLR